MTNSRFDSLRFLAKFAAALLLIVITLNVANSTWHILASKSALETVHEGFVKQSMTITPLLQASADIKIDVIQVQQWLTDLAATRGVDGLDEGGKVAETYARKFKADILKAKGLATTLGDTAILETIGNVERAFPDYYSAGKNVVQVYVEKGPSAGNLLMRPFDKKAEIITSAIEKMINLVNASVQANMDQVNQNIVIAEWNNSIGFIVTGIILLISLVITWLVIWKAFRISNAISITISALKSAAKGNLNDRITNIKGVGEVRDVQQAVNRFLDYIEVFTRESGAAMTHAAKGEYFRTIISTGLVGDFNTRAKIINAGLNAMQEKTDKMAEEAEKLKKAEEHTAIEMQKNSEKYKTDARYMGNNLKEVAQSLSGVANEMQNSSESILKVATETNQQSDTAADSANEANNSVGSVAAATEEFSASIMEISQQVSHAADMGKDAVQRVEKAETTIQTLSDAASKINEVVNLIGNIASQTNLLALNATIEAARAGEAGKGFAVVASEVKNLANQTATATEEIINQVNDMQVATSEAVSAIDNIGDAIHKIDETGTTIAATVDEQRAVVNEISSSIQLAVQQVGVVADNITLVSRGANSTATSISQIQSAARDLGTRSKDMNNDVNSFVETVASS